MAKLPPHGTVSRYRRELKSKTVCVRCRSANSQARSRQRARARQRGVTPILSIVPDTPAAHTNAATPAPPAAPQAPSADYVRVPAWGQTEKAIREDLLTADTTAPFYNSLRAAALVLAREIDDVDGRTSKAPLVKQLVDTIRELKGKDTGNGASFADLLDELSKPLVAAAPVLD